MDKDRTIEILKDYVKREDFSEFCRMIIDEIGINNFLKLLKITGGSNVYLPNLERGLYKARDRIIVKEFNGFNHKELAKKYNITENWVRQIVHNQGDKRKESL